jgi:nitric oxide reductase subunit B
MTYKKLWMTLTLVFIASLAVFLYYGGEIYQVKPPIPEKVVTQAGSVVFTKQDIEDGQNIWQRMGGQEVAAAVVGIAMFVIGLATGRSYERSSAASSHAQA